MVKKQVVPFYENYIFKKYDIKNIQRVGIIFHHSIKNTGMLDQTIENLTHKKIKRSDNINLSFSKKLPTVVGSNIKNIQDFNNAIFNFKQTDKEFFQS